MMINEINKIIAALKQTEVFNSSIIWEVEQNGNAYIKLYYEPKRFWLEVFIGKDFYYLFLVRNCSIINSSELKKYTGFTEEIKYFENWIYHPYESSFRINSDEEFNNLISVIVKNLKYLMKESKVFTKDKVLLSKKREKGLLF